LTEYGTDLEIRASVKMLSAPALKCYLRQLSARIWRSAPALKCYPRQR